jgi:hypothetical protein
MEMQVIVFILKDYCKEDNVYEVSSTQSYYVPKSMENGPYKRF